MSKDKRLRLRAQTAADIAPLSALLQDATVRVADMAYRAEARRFVLLANRFRWEKQAARRWFGTPERVRAALRLDFVDKARLTGIDLEDKERVLDLLALTAAPTDAKADSPATLTLVFAGEGAIALQLEVIDATLEDVSAPWPASGRPDHERA
ncbi:MAG: DUF2948 family protein [Pseudomonadota bacterium]|jgi:hypothetical protein